MIDEEGADDDGGMGPLDPGFADRFEQEGRRLPLPCQLYLISPPSIGPDFAELLRAALDGGPVAAFQLRLKGLNDDAVVDAALPLQALCAERDVAFIVNDSIAIAKRLGADG